MQQFGSALAGPQSTLLGYGGLERVIAFVARRPAEYALPSDNNVLRSIKLWFNTPVELVVNAPQVS